METRKAQEARIKGGIVLPDDVRVAQGFVNRLRSAFSWVRGISASEALDETTLDGLLIVKSAVQSVVSSGRAAEGNIRDLVLSRAAAGDALFERSATSDTVFLGLPTHEKRFSVAQHDQTSFDQKGFIASLVADGLLTQDEADDRVAQFTTMVIVPKVIYKPNPAFGK